MRRIAWVVFAVGVCGCGSAGVGVGARSEPVRPEASPVVESSAPAASPPAADEAQWGDGDPEIAGGVPAPDPAVDPYERLLDAAREAPAIVDEASAAQALARGFYGDVERVALAKAGEESSRRAAWLVLAARAQLAVGKYREAAENAGRAGAAGVVLRAEALARCGMLAEAERVIAPLAAQPHAWRAMAVLAGLHARRGREVEARALCMRLIDAYNAGTIDSQDAEGLHSVGLAAWGLGSAQDANDAFREALAADGMRAETALTWARLFLEKYDPGHAEEWVRQVLEGNPADAEAIALLARIRISQSFNFAAAERLANRALAINPNLVDAHVTLAGMLLRDQDFVGADARLDQALGVDPTDLEALSVRAAVRFVASDARGFAAAKRAVLAQNPRFSRMDSILADYADWEHRYPELVDLAREALRIDPEDAGAWGTLGLNLLRVGDEQHGLEALHEAWDRDRFNVYVYNTLNLYDDVIAREYDELPRGPFVFRMHRSERPMLERYVPALLTRAYDAMRARYGLRPEGPIRVEMFADAQHFAVRTSGLPNLGVQGVCFGKVITAISPRGGPFNWGQILWHELAHVFHIQLSRNRVPRWFTEGLAEYETIVARRGVGGLGREDDVLLYRALVGGRIPPLRLMNRAFTHARSPEDMMAAYYASAKLAAFLVGQYGMSKIVDMLRAWGAGEETPRVVEHVLGVSVDDVDAAFRAWLTHELARQEALAAGHESYEGHVDRARRALARGAVAEARSELEAAVQLDPDRGVAWDGLAHVAARSGDTEREIAALREEIRIDPHDREAMATLLDRLLARQRWDELADLAETAIQIDPHRGRTHLLLAQAYLATGRRAEGLFELDSAVLAGGESATQAARLREERAGSEGGR